MLSQVRSVSSGYWIHFEFPMTLIRLIDYPLMGEGARNIYDPANDMPADYIVKASAGTCTAMRHRLRQSPHTWRARRIRAPGYSAALRVVD